jgi:hypothetical protein
MFGDRVARHYRLSHWHRSIHSKLAGHRQGCWWTPSSATSFSAATAASFNPLRVSHSAAWYKAATTTIPIVFTSIDPVKFGLVASLNRPGGNLTGVNVLAIDLDGKRLELLSEMVPASAFVAVLINPHNEYAEQQAEDVQEGAPASAGKF